MSTAIARWIGGQRVEVPPRRENATRRALLPMLAPILRSLSKGDGGRTRATYAVLRVMLWQDYRYACGDESIRVAVNTAARRGILHRRQVRANPHDRTGRIEIWYPDEAEKRAARWRDKTAKRKERQQSRAHDLQQPRRETGRRHGDERLPLLVQAVLPELSTPKPESQAVKKWELPPDRSSNALHIRTTLAAIQGVEAPALGRGEKPDEVAVRAHDPSILVRSRKGLAKLGAIGREEIARHRLKTLKEHGTEQSELAKQIESVQPSEARESTRGVAEASHRARIEAQLAELSRLGFEIRSSSRTEPEDDPPDK